MQKQYGHKLGLQQSLMQRLHSKSPGTLGFSSPTLYIPQQTNCFFVLPAVRYLISQGFLLNPSLFLGLLKGQSQLLLGLHVPAQSCFFSLAGSAGIRLVKFCQLSEKQRCTSRRLEGRLYHDTVHVCKNYERFAVSYRYKHAN